MPRKAISIAISITMLCLGLVTTPTQVKAGKHEGSKACTFTEVLVLHVDEGLTWDRDETVKVPIGTFTSRDAAEAQAAIDRAIIAANITNPGFIGFLLAIADANDNENETFTGLDRATIHVANSCEEGDD